jgi:hypothetical protein
MDIREAAVLGSKMRFRAVMMTSFAFIFGVYPLVVAQGAAEISRHGVGTPVFAGMIAASAVGIFVIPMLYVVFQSLRERSSGAFWRLPKLRKPFASIKIPYLKMKSFLRRQDARIREPRTSRSKGP